jgi:hypothetical protein
MDKEIEKQVREAIAILEGVNNKFTRDIIALYQRGYDLTDEQVKHFLEAAQRHKKSLERGYTGLDHGVKGKAKDRYQPKGEIVKGSLRYKRKYLLAEVKPLLDSLGLAIERVCTDPNRPSMTHYRVYDPKVKGDEGLLFKTLALFVEWGTNGDPSHPLANGKED